MTYTVRNISVSIGRPAARVYQFASNPENLPAWVEFIESMAKESEDIWLAKTDLGTLRIKFTPENEFGIIDHLVTLPDGSMVSNPMRVVANGKGSELVFTLFWIPNRSEEEFCQDARSVARDLQRIKQILETE